MDITIQVAEATDLDGILELLNQVLMVHHKGRPDLFKPNATKYSKEEMARILKRPECIILVAHDVEGKVCGYAICQLQDKESKILTDIRSLYLDDLCVDERHRGMGIGYKLYQAVVSTAKQKKCYNVTLNVWACNPSAVKFYEKCGLQIQKIGMETIL